MFMEYLVSMPTTVVLSSIVLLTENGMDICLSLAFYIFDKKTITNIYFECANVPGALDHP